MSSRGLIALVGIVGVATSAWADETIAPTPRGAIYPGEIIRENMLGEGAFELDELSNAIKTRGEAVGRVAKRTLFPGRPIGAAYLEDRYTIVNGSLVQLIYEQPGISIVASGLALQSARAGEAIRVRNVESGLAVTGTVSSAGKVLVGK
ncbi:MAG: flagellar basal body P-ring formation protein FlgA [Methylobacteriaceae bacterium]|nr:flagellar basal body P-ring formation protein FlgA [Methylobacteriaceae bacterium]